MSRYLKGFAISMAFAGCATPGAATQAATPVTVATSKDACPPGHTGMQPMSANADGAKKAFDAKPKPGEKGICAVSGEVFDITPETKTAEFKGKYFVFCCDSCEPEFKADPAKFAGI